MGDLPRSVLWLMADQLSASVLADPAVRTPNLDRLADEGVRCNAAYTPSPVCVPGRFAALTGKYPHRTGCTGNGTPLPLRERTAAHHFRERGYATAFLGKLHPVAPHTAGFDYYVDFGHYYDYLGPRVERFVHGLGARNSGCGAPWVDVYHDLGNPWGRSFPERPSGSALPLDDHFDRFIAREAVRFLRGHGHEPFLLVVSFLAPHAPFTPAPEFDAYDPALRLPPTATPQPARCIGADASNLHPHGGWFLPPGGDPRRDDDARRWLAAYHGNISQLDSCVGIVLDELAALGLAERTAVVATSDHGELAYEHGLFGKGVFLEGSVRVPLLVRDRSIPAGTIAAHPIDLTDLLPTSLGLAGLPPVDGLDGVDAGPALRGGSSPRLHALSELTDSRRPRWMLRDRRWKYVLEAGGGQQLFDLMADPLERRDLAAEAGQAAVAAGCRARLAERFPAAGA